MPNKNFEIVGQHFAKIWDRYLQSVEKNLLHHHETLNLLNDFLTQHFRQKTFTLADLGCGDASSLLHILQKQPITHFIGVDIAESLIEKGSKALEKLDCKKELICHDMSTAFERFSINPDIIYSGYALHHFSYDEKIKFIANCQKYLAPNGYFILVDIVKKEDQTQTQWFADFKERFLQYNSNLNESEIEERIAHPRDYDFPESVATYRKIAAMQNWRTFEELFEMDGCAFLVFGK